MTPIPVRATQSADQRPFALLTTEVASSTNSTARQTILTPSKGFRIRLVRIRVIQDDTDGRHLWELYFGDGANLVANLTNGIDILIIPDKGSDSTRVYPRNQGPRGLRDEVVSGRWRGSGPTKAHTIIIEYTEEP